MTTLIPRNTTIPTRKSETFTTAADNQTSVEVHVLQGERPLARDNRTLGRFTLVGLPQAPRGIPQIEVAFDLDANGIVNVSAKDRATGKEQRITITASSGLSKDEVDRMMREAESHSEEDKRRRDVIDARNQADGLIYSIEKTLAENRAKLAPADVSGVETALHALREVAPGDNLEAIRKGIDEAQRAAHRMAEALYKQSEPAPGGPSAPGGGEAAPGAGGGSSDVIDAEVVDDGKK
jgi:molecular chaperone DnaK